MRIRKLFYVIFILSLDIFSLIMGREIAIASDALDVVRKGFSLLNSSDTNA